MKKDPIEEPELIDDDAPKASDDRNGTDGKELAEYPLTLVARRVPYQRGPDGQTLRDAAGKPIPIKTLTYEGTVHIDGQLKPQQWIATGSDAFGLAVGQDQDLFVAAFDIWKEHGFKDRHIPITSTWSLLRRMHHGDRASDYQRLQASLDRLTGMYYVAVNAIWDDERKTYVARMGFHLFNAYKLYPRRRGDRQRAFFGYIEASEELYDFVVKGKLKPLDLTTYKELPNPTSRRLFRYLDKHKRRRTFSINVRRLCQKLGMVTAAQRYWPKKLENELAPALAELQTARYLYRSYFRPGRDGRVLCVEFSEPPKTRTGNTFNLTDDQAAYARVLAHDIAEVCGQGDKNAGWYYKLAAEAIRDHTEHTLLRPALSDVRQAKTENEIHTTPSQYLNACLEARRRQYTLPLTPPTS